ncbi:peptidoglycan-binding protein [Mesorhizobium sp.]|uniref:peptidoglycan-binding domain-containing protein n=1 Tax=Mesorhizobium sp. TaxID=1871066 RepID=UPI000FE90718|nr:peptidoglycan-binding domain-containing protein [Mesorhizobium sp.]RWN27586.1 MAG: hypothetical protein EOR95_24305 [Mesorhizobium sp.]
MTITDNQLRAFGGLSWAGLALLWLGLLVPQTALAISAERIIDSVRPMQVVTLDLEPVSAVYSKDGETIFVAGKPLNADGGIIVEYDRLSLSPRREFRLPHSVEALHLGPAGDRLVAAGNFADQSSGALSSVRLQGGEVVTARMQTLLELPSISIGRSGKIYLSHLQSNRIAGISPMSFDEPRSNDGQFLSFDALIVDAYFFDSKTPIRQIIVSEEDRAIFVVPDEVAKIYAMELKGFGQLLGEAGYSTAGGVNLPLAAFASRVTTNEHPGGRMSFLLADHQMQGIMLHEYDPKFRTINLITIAGVGHALIPGTSIELLPRTGSIRQPMLIASDRNLSKILSANVYSRELVIFTREPGADYLEQVAKLLLEKAPSAIAVHPYGEDAVVLFKDGREMLLLSDPGRAPATSGTKDVPIQRTGEESVRDLQKALTRHGLPVGSIDGVLGARTKHALDLAKREFLLEADPGNLDTVVKELNAATPRFEKF